MKRRIEKFSAIGLSLLFILTTPGFEASQALATVVLQQHNAAPITVAAKIGSVGGISNAAASALNPSLSHASLTGLLSLTPPPGVLAPTVISPVAIPAQLPEAAISRASPSSLAPTELPAPAQAKAGPARTTLEDLTQGSQRISEASRPDSSGVSQRQAIDELFLGRKTFSPADVDVSPVTDLSPSGLRPAALQRAPSSQAQAVLLSPQRAEKPQRSFLRSLRVGWLAAIAPLAITIIATTAAGALGYHIHAGYQSPIPHELTAVSALATAAFVSVMAPISEEMIFRNEIMGSLRRMMRRIPLVGEFWLPALISSVVFVALHELSDPLLFATRLAHSLILSYAYHKEGLASSTIAHAFFNGLLFMPMVLSLLPAAAAAIAGLLALPIGAWMTWRAYKTLKAQAADREAGRIQPVEITALPSALLALLLLGGFLFMAHNPVWLAGALGYAWRAFRLFREKLQADRKTL